MRPSTYVGLLGAVLTTGAWLPQLVRTWRVGSARDLSWAYLLTMLGGFACWLGYGFSRHDAAVLAANGVSLALVLALSGFKVAVERE